MAERVELKQKTVNAIEFGKVVDTSFNYFTQPEPTADTDTIEELFRLYDKLYVQIPTTGPNSHQYLVEQSTKIYPVESSIDIEPLQNEIADLRARLLEANTQIQDLSTQLVSNG